MQPKKRTKRTEIGLSVRMASSVRSKKRLRVALELHSGDFYVVIKETRRQSMLAISDSTL